MLRRELKFAIIDSGRTQREVSIRTGIPETRLSAIVRNRVDPSEQERAALAFFLGRPATDLFGDTELERAS